MTDLADRIAAVLRDAPAPLTVVQIADAIGASPHDVDRVIWDDPQRFAWQPGHKWALGTERPTPVASATWQDDAREGPLAPRPARELRAVTLTSGVRLRVSRRALDTHAFFTVRSAGSDVELILNSSHELFARHPMPFGDDASSPDMARLLEVVLEAWALYEDSLPEGSARRSAQDARLYWGRRVAEVLRDDSERQ